jgi:hypothetical protein
MKNLKRIQYFTMNSRNRSTAPAYNLKIYNVIDNKLQNTVFELMECENFFDIINQLIQDFDTNNNYEWQAGFNGRSGGYLVLYRGGCKKKTFTKEDFKKSNGYNGRAYISDRYGWKSLKEAEAMGIIDKPIIIKIYSQPGKEITESEVPVKVLKAFRKLAISIVQSVEEMAKQSEIIDEEYTIQKTRKIAVIG